MNTFYKALGERIKKMREKANFSQEDLGRLLDIHRVSLSQMEKGDRKITAEELAKLSNTFNISTDVLLDLKKDFEIVFADAIKKKTSDKQETRINVPQKNVEKFKEVLLYLLNKVGSKTNVGETVIYKLLYFIDFNFYEKYEEQLIGATYQKNIHGPTPIEFLKIVEEMEGTDLTKIATKYFKYPQTRYIALRAPDLSKLKAHEIKLIDDVLEHLSDMNATQISDYSHDDVPWLTTEDQGIIEYESVFYRTPAYSVRSYGEDI